VSVTLAFNLTAYTALARLEAAAGAIADTLMAGQQLLQWHEGRATALLGGSASGAAAGGSAGATLLARPPTAVRWFLDELAAGQGAAHVGRALTEDSEGAHPLLLRELTAWARVQEADAAALGGSAGGAAVAAAAALPPAVATAVTPTAAAR
jgi:hypothetical protein